MIDPQHKRKERKEEGHLDFTSGKKIEEIAPTPRKKNLCLLITMREERVVPDVMSNHTWSLEMALHYERC